MLRNVQIADLRDQKGKIKTVTAEKGVITTEEGSKYMTLVLENGYYYEDHIKTVMLPSDRKRMMASKATFDSYVINIDVSSFKDDENLDREDVKSHHGMLSIKQLDSISKDRKLLYDEYITNRSNRFYTVVKGNRLYQYPDSLVSNTLVPEVLDNFTPMNKVLVVDEAIKIASASINRNENQKESFKTRRKILNLYDFEFSYRISFSLACLVLFFIGAPLGSIIRKGGFGLPMVMAIIIFVIYFFISQLGKNLAEESAITSLFGSWLSTLILLPFGVLLTRRATQGMGVFNLDAYTDKLQQFFKRFGYKTSEDTT
jgi:lipopolysaccharide export system permease protein